MHLQLVENGRSGSEDCGHLAEQVREQAALLDGAQEAIFVESLDHLVTYWNKGAERLYGHSAADALGHEPVELFYRGNPTRLQEARAQVLAQGAWTGRLRQRTRDDRDIVVQSLWSLVRDVDGTPRSILVFNTDVTEVQRLETRFMRAQRLESIGALAGGIAHDLNNVLAPILMAAQVLSRKLDDPKSLRMIETIEASAQRGADLVKQVLTFARGAEGDRVRVQPAHLIHEIEKMLRGTLSKSIQLEAQLPKDLWHIVGQATPLHQVLMNLCVNARDAMPEGGRLTLRAENLTMETAQASRYPEASAGRYVRISVSDTGTGIDESVRSRIFDPFFTTKPVGKGTGLGLSTSLSIVRDHGGFIEVESRPGYGTTFEIFFPAADDSARSESQRPALIEIEAGRGELILCVDDEVSILLMMREVLEDGGYRVVTARDGGEAVSMSALLRGEIDLVISDISMPRLDGQTLIHSLHQSSPDVPVVAISGLPENARPSIDGLCLTCFVSKPFAAAELLRAVQASLASHSTSD